MAKRLIFDKIMSDDCEKSMIMKLKTEFPYLTVFKLEKMITDINVSEILMNEFRKNSSSHTQFDLSLKILTTSIWPLRQTIPSAQLPENIAASTNCFYQFYSSNYAGRKLSLQTPFRFSRVVRKF